MKYKSEGKEIDLGSCVTQMEYRNLSKQCEQTCKY